MNWAATIGRTAFPNPVLAASGTFGFGVRFPNVANGLGGVVTKGITLRPRAGNPPPRICEFPGGIINSVGLENPGLEAFKRDVLPGLRRLTCRVVVNIAGFTVDEYRELALGLDEDRVDAIELNVSCPNVREGGAVFGRSPRRVEAITRAVCAVTSKTVIVKLTANFVDPVATAKAAEAGGADAVTAINTLFGLALDESGRPFLGGRSGGISGPALRPFALFCIDRVANAVRIPVIGCGGVMTGRDALDFLSAGASMVQVGTASLVDPRAPLLVWRELKAWCRKNGVEDWCQLVGRVRRTD
jgi:dihydroorotate dehydrogenase (NAD+) catalytic subunit